MQNNFAIIGVAKLKTEGNVSGVLAHMFRERFTPNDNGLPIDVRIKPNGVDGVMQYVNQFERRSNSVIGYDFLLTASPAFFKGLTPDELESWKQDSQRWLEDTFGKENVVALVFHDKSETTCHAQALIIPQKDGRLNAREWTGGRQKMRALWTSYARAMQKYGLKRGRMFSPAEHQSIKEYYSQVNEAKTRDQASKVLPKQLPSPTVEDRLHPREYASRLINEAVSWYRRENSSLRVALDAERRQRERLIGKTSHERERVSFLKENPEAFAELESALAGMQKDKATTEHRFAMLVDAVRKYFDRCIPANSTLRRPDRLGDLAQFPELMKHIRLSLRDRTPRPDREQTQERG